MTKDDSPKHIVFKLLTPLKPSWEIN